MAGWRLLRVGVGCSASSRGEPRPREVQVFEIHGKAAGGGGTQIGECAQNATKPFACRLGNAQKSVAKKGTVDIRPYEGQAGRGASHTGETSLKKVFGAESRQERQPGGGSRSERLRPSTRSASGTSWQRQVARSWVKGQLSHELLASHRPAIAGQPAQGVWRAVPRCRTSQSRVLAGAARRQWRQSSTVDAGPQRG